MARRRVMRRTGAAVSALFALVALPAVAQARYLFNFPHPVTPIAIETLHVHDIFLEITAALFFVVLSVMAYSLYHHRRSRKYEPARFTGPKGKLQWVLVTLPFLLLIFIDYVILGIPAYHSVLAQADTKSGAQMIVKVIGSQWKWQYEYPGLGISYVSRLSTPANQIDGQAPKNQHFLLQVNHPMVLPVNEKVRIILASDDVLHSWWVPAFGVKEDVVPGFIRETWVDIDKPGVYRGQCAELCGVGHAFMPIVVQAKTPAGFARWVALEQLRQKQQTARARQGLTKAQLLRGGQAVFQHNCAVCHQSNGEGIPGTFPPIAAGRPFAAPPDMTDALAARGFYRNGHIVLGPVMQHIRLVLLGINHTPMPAFASQLSDIDIAAVITYERNSFGNKSGDVIQPEQVHAQRALAH